MKRLFTFVFTMLLGAGLAFAQTGGGSTDAQAHKSDKKTTKTSKAHKGGKKSKKGAGANNSSTSAPPPK